MDFIIMEIYTTNNLFSLKTSNLNKINKNEDTVNVNDLLNDLSKLLGVDGIDVVSELPSDAANNTKTLYLVTSN